MEISRLYNKGKKETLTERGRKKDQGFLVVIFGLFFPIIAVCIFYLTEISISYKYKSRANTLCRKYLINSQMQSEREIKKLISMNSIAKSLRLQRQSSRAALNSAKLTGFAPAIAAAKANDLRVQFLQLSFRAQQNIQLAKIRIQSHRNSVKTRSQFLSKMNGTSQITQFKSPQPQFKISPRNSLSPSINRASHFSKKQHWSMKWKIKLNSKIPKWALGNPIINLKGSCGATIERKNLQWKATLKKDIYI